jgi:hypothetical protein
MDGWEVPGLVGIAADVIEFIVGYWLSSLQSLYKRKAQILGYQLE